MSSGGRAPHRGGSAPPGGPPARGAALEFAALGGGLTVVMCALARVPNWAHQLREFQALYAIAFGFYALAVIRLPRYRSLPAAGLLVLAVAFAGRAALLPVPPTLSDDVYRYVWEGRVIRHGGNPYRTSPASAELAPLRDTVIWPRVNHPELATIYPPLAEAAFAVVTRVSESAAGMKAWIVLSDLAVAAVLLRWCAQRGQGAAAALVYAWNPLVLVEYAGSAHLEPAALLMLAIAMAWMDRRPVLSALALAAAVMIKLAPLVVLPLLALRWPVRARWVCALALAPGLAWFWSQTRGADSGLSAYWLTWRNNALIFDALAFVTGSFALARTAALAAVAVAIAWALARSPDPASGSRTVLRTATLVSPVIHPWYLGWTLLFEPLGPSAPWLLLSATACLSYGLFAAPADRATYHLPALGRLIEFGLPALMAVALWSARRAGFAGGRDEGHA